MSNKITIKGLDLPESIKRRIEECLNELRTGLDIKIAGILFNSHGVIELHPYRDESSDMAETREEAADRLYEQSGHQIDDRKVGKSPLLGMGYSGTATGRIDDIYDHVSGSRSTTALSFAALRVANRVRCPMFKNAKGETQHSGSDWSPNDWMVATFGELGEAANVMKKVRRGDMTLAEARPKLAQEFSDVIIYLDMLADECGVNLSEAVMETFNAKSDQLELPLYLTEDGFQTTKP